jgi:hypothetical protein
MIVGQRGYAGSVLPDEVDELAHFNFAGRNIKQIQSPYVLAQRLNVMLDNPNLLLESGQFAKSYYRNNLDASIGAKRLEEILVSEMEKSPPLQLKRAAIWIGYCTFCCFWVMKGIFSRLFKSKRRMDQLKRIEKLKRDAMEYAVIPEM